MSDAPRILIVSCLRNEGPYLLDWLAHLQVCGATDFLLYSNDCEDGTDHMLDLLQGAGLVTHLRHSPEPGRSIQWQAFRQAWKRPERKVADWVLACDVDEFPAIKAGQGRFADLIGAVPEDTDAILLPWRMFGANGNLRRSEAPVTASCPRSASPDCQFPILTTFFKTLFRPAGPFNQLGIHRPSQKAPDKAGLPHWVDGSGAPLPEAFARASQRLSQYDVTSGRDLVELHHYSLRSVEATILKRMRGLPNHRDRVVDLAYWVERNFNTVETPTLAPLAPATGQARAALDQIDGLAEAHLRAAAWHDTTYQAFIRAPDGYALMAQMALAGDSAELSEDQARLLYRQYQNVSHGT